jgi:hypothetical protein
MRFFYFDPALRNDVGHHANYCRYIVGELRARGIETLVFGRRTVVPALQAELGVVPRFRYHTYAKVDPDPFAGWLIDSTTVREQPSMIFASYRRLNHRMWFM